MGEERQWSDWSGDVVFEDVRTGDREGFDGPHHVWAWSRGLRVLLILETGRWTDEVGLRVLDEQGPIGALSTTMAEAGVEVAQLGFFDRRRSSSSRERRR